MKKPIAEIFIEEASQKVLAEFESNDRTARSPRDLASDIISALPEENLNDIYMFFPDVAAQMAAMSDNPGLMASEHNARIELYEAEFQKLKQGLVLFRPAPYAKEMKS